MKGFVRNGYEMRAEMDRRREIEMYEDLKERLAGDIDRFVLLFVKMEKYSFVLNVDDYIFESDDLDSVLSVVESCLEECRIDERYLDWDFELDKDSLKIKCYSKELERKKEEEETKREETERRALEDSQKSVNDYIDECKDANYTGLLDLNKINRMSRMQHKCLDWIAADFFIENWIIPFRNDIKTVNPKQYQIFHHKKNNNSVDFTIKGNKPYIDDILDFKSKEKLKQFLDISKRVYVSEDMFFMPFRFKKDNHFHILVINNILKNIESYRLPSLNYLNKHHNLHYVLETNTKEDFKVDFNGFKIFVLCECQKIVNFNSAKLYELYVKISHFKDEKTISKTIQIEK